MAFVSFNLYDEFIHIYIYNYVCFRLTVYGIHGDCSQNQRDRVLRSKYYFNIFKFLCHIQW